MRRIRGEEGYFLIAVMLFMAMISSLIFISLSRSEIGYRLVADRYFNSVAIDLAENGIIYETRMISNGQMAGLKSPHKEYIGRFAYYDGSFETFAEKGPGNSYKIISEGKLIDKNGNVKFSIRISALLNRDSAEHWRTIEWSEKDLSFSKAGVKM